MRALTTTAVLLFLAPLAACSGRPESPPPPQARTAVAPGQTAVARGSDTLDMTTWSVVGVDPATGDVGVAMASCVANTLADALAALVPGKGAAATQAAFDVNNRNTVLAALKEGLPAAAIIRRVADSSDTRLGNRQYGVVTMSGGRAQTAGFTGKPMLDGVTGPAPATGPRRWAGIRADASRGVSVQGNTLVSEAVVANGLAAYTWEDPTGFNALPDRLMRALEAGSVAGGDVRCNSDSVRQTAATAMIVVARGTDAPYATERIGLSDQGTPAAPWLAISVTNARGEDNPLLELRKRYDVWRRTMRR
jgi:uncharacterized Ntn-hydrolase superfamily protein